MKRTVQQSAHPWHGVDAEHTDEWVTAYIEIVPSDGVKYELDKETGLLRVDRPQTFSSMCPSLYGFIPQTYCGKTVAKRTMERTGFEDIQGDADPIDICVISEKGFPHGNFLVRARPIGGFRMIDGDEADDKIIAVLQGDLAYGKIEDIADLPLSILERLRHYFLSYKQLPNDGPRRVIIPETYDRFEAHEVIKRTLHDYKVEIAGTVKATRAAAGRKAAAKTGTPKVSAKGKAPKKAKAADAEKAPKKAKAPKKTKATEPSEASAITKKVVRKKTAPRLAVAARVAKAPAAKTSKRA